jgi:hypothetical protein
MTTSRNDRGVLWAPSGIRDQAAAGGTTRPDFSARSDSVFGLVSLAHPQLPSARARRVSLECPWLSDHTWCSQNSNLPTQI